VTLDRQSRLDSAVGVWTAWLECPEVIERGERRRFVQASLDESDLYRDGAQPTRFAADPLPGIYPAHALRRASGAPDPFDRLLDDPNWDGADVGWTSVGLPDLQLERPRLVNAGSRVVLYGLAHIGDRLRQRSCYLEVAELDGRSGPMTRVVTRTEYANQVGDMLLVMDNAVICRAAEDAT
jgi:hypothetical protein